MAENLYCRIELALLEKHPGEKCSAVNRLIDDWDNGILERKCDTEILPMDDPGRPDQPELVDPRNLQRRSTSTEKGRVFLLHAIAHIEFCAINIALDAVYRFRDMPDQFISDWLRVADEETKHFYLLDNCLRQRDSYYGEFAAHGGLWDMVCKTRHDVMHRMALIPRVMEARGLDVTPGMMNRFDQVGDQQVVDILHVIYEEEIGHVAAGSYWYQTICLQRGLDPDATFELLIDEYFKGGLRGSFNWPARLKAGFKETELKALERQKESFKLDNR
ncbi:MAG: ferritin-like domain-containing protein [Gammaproteobacteria bacterium]|nr:ferritin-like domain-containing protein [Gammaproteobacteria bacterium]